LLPGFGGFQICIEIPNFFSQQELVTRCWLAWIFADFKINVITKQISYLNADYYNRTNVIAPVKILIV